jgi:hypothetical protein
METKGRPKGEAKGGSIMSSLVGGVADMEVASGMSTLSWSDKRKTQEIGSSPENQPACRRSKAAIKAEVGESSQTAIVARPSRASSSKPVVMGPLADRCVAWHIDALEEQVKDLYTFVNKSVENLQGQIDAVHAEAESASGPSSKQVGPSETPVSKGCRRGKGKQA